MYSIGAGVPQDYAETVRWYRRAAEQGSADAQCVPWLYHHEGRRCAEGPPPDGTGGYYDFSRSADGTAKPSQIYQC